MKTIEISDEAFLVVGHSAQRLTNGDVAAYIDRLVGVAGDSRDYEPIPANTETEFLRAHHLEKLSNPEIVCAILDLVRKKAPRRFESIVGFRFPDRRHVVVSRHTEEFADARLAHRIGDSDVHLSGGFDSKQLKKLFHELLTTMGYSAPAAQAFERYIRKSAATDSIALKYV